MRAAGLRPQRRRPARRGAGRAACPPGPGAGPPGHRALRGGGARRAGTAAGVRRQGRADRAVRRGGAPHRVTDRFGVHRDRPVRRPPGGRTRPGAPSCP
ncbi:hypothetical protein SGPA1_12608 [Streptomyces misionensis JCM 4497]